MSGSCSQGRALCCSAHGCISLHFSKLQGDTVQWNEKKKMKIKRGVPRQKAYRDLGQLAYLVRSHCTVTSRVVPTGCAKMFIEFHIWDEDWGKKDDHLGSCTLKFEAKGCWLEMGARGACLRNRWNRLRLGFSLQLPPKCWLGRT